MKGYIKLLRWIWEFPQCLLGFILTLCYKVDNVEEFKEIPIYAGEFPGGISLGLFILIDESKGKYNRSQIKEHEGGHTRQSLYLGPLYLIVIGIPSIFGAGRYNPLTHGSYYKYGTESWADALGGIIKR